MRLDGQGGFRYARSLLPVPVLDSSADNLFGFGGFKTFEKTLTLEILSNHVRALETRVDVNEEMDITCPSWFAEQFIGQLLPHGLPSCVVNDITESNSLVRACTCLEGKEISCAAVVREIEAYMMQDLADDCWKLDKTLNVKILEEHFNFVKGHECLALESSTTAQVEHAIKPEPSVLPLIRDGGCEEGISVQQILDDASFNLKVEEFPNHNSVETFRLKSWDKDSPLEQHSCQSIPYSITDIHNLTGIVGEWEVEGPTELLDFDTADYLLDKLQVRPKLLQHNIQAEISPSCMVGCLSLLDENSVPFDTNTGTKHAVKNTMKNLFELPEILEDGYLGHSPDLKLGKYINYSLMKPNPVEIEDLDSRDIAFQCFEKLLVLPELALQTSNFHFLQAPTFIKEHQPRIHEGVFKELFQVKTMSNPTSASDTLYLDWHLSQVGHCNNYGCFHLQRRVVENELSVTSQRDMTPGKRITDQQLLLGLADDFLPWHHAETGCENDSMEYPAVKLHASVSTSVLNSSNFTYTADKMEDKNYSDQSVLTDEKTISTKDQATLPGFSPSSMDDVLSLMKLARQGVLPRDSKSTQASETESHQEENCQTLEPASIVVKTPGSNPLRPAGVDSASNFLFQALNHVEPEFPANLESAVHPSQEILEIGFKSAPTLQPALEELNQYQSEVDDLTEVSNGLGPHLVLVANILQPGGSILMQRRSSYQKILGLENEDLQVVERELMLPVDLILNPSTCLTVYTKDKLLGHSNIWSSNSDEFFSCVMDTIVDSHMKALSFSFQRWFMIFEGELAFNSAVTNILPKLYISSAGFGMRVQGFISTDSIATDSLVLKCIKKMWRMSKRPFDSPMAEDLNDCEICLANFPSLNPLSSHAILCLHTPIACFISLSPEEQNSSLQGFDVRSESLNLLKAQALYGKLKTTSYSQNFSESSWPAASEILASGVKSHVNDAFSYFPPASEIGTCEVPEKSARESAAVRLTDENSGLCSPTSPDPRFQYHSPGQDISAWNGVPNDLCWPYDDDQPSTLPLYANGPNEEPNNLEENYNCSKPVDVQSLLQRFVQGRREGVRDLKHEVTEPDLFCDSFKVLNNESYHARSSLKKSPPSAEYAADAFHWTVPSTDRWEVTDELRLTPLLKISAKRNISALEQFRHQKRVAPALRFRDKKVRPAGTFNSSRDDVPRTPLENSLKISRNSCYKSNPVIGRSN